MTSPMVPDPIAAGIAKGWKIVDAAAIEQDRTLDADVVIVGSGAGGGVTAEILVRAGLSVIVVEEGALKSSTDFKMREADAYPSLYQESAARKTKDKAISTSPPCRRKPQPSARLQTAIAAPSTVSAAAGQNPRSSGAPTSSRIVTAE